MSVCSLLCHGVEGSRDSGGHGQIQSGANTAQVSWRKLGS